ncbi:hypothetical protein OIV83_000652 [Microbotryomycetes sp. JL201]|nr:hypothetical protein OIV83_000652 [Microbotryomycetes sp. JL201]
MPARNLHDTRLLTNLIKTEKDAQQSFKRWTKDTTSASAALSAWSVADSGDTQDLMPSDPGRPPVTPEHALGPETGLQAYTELTLHHITFEHDQDISVRISQLLAACGESQKAYINALSAWRASLKDVLDRENSLRTVVRDREILVGRLIKLGNKKPSDSGMDKHQSQLDDAHRELAACETFLQEEELLLAEAKRRSFRDSLSFRMRALGDLGRTMEDSAAEAVELLSRLGEGEFEPQNYEFDHEQGHDQDEGQDDLQSNDGDSMTPSQSASQAMSRNSSSSSLLDEIDNPITGASANPRALSPTAAMPKAVVPARSPRALSPNRGSRATSPARVASPTGAPSDRRLASAIVPRAASVPRASALPRPNLGPVPSAPRPISSFLQADEGAMPSFDIPKAPTHVATRGPNDDSSDEEIERDFEAHTNRPQMGHHNTLHRQSVVGNRMRADSDASSTGRPGSGQRHEGRKRRGSFFGGFASLFKRKDKHARNDDDSDYGVKLKSSRSSKWETRTDRNVFAAHHLGGGGGGGGGRNILGRSRDDSSSDDEAMPRNVVRIVNDPKARTKAMSDVGRSLSPEPSITKKKKKKTKVPEKAMSDIGVQARSALIPPPPTKRMSSSASVPRAGTVTSTLPPPVPAVPASVKTSTPATADTDSVTVKKKKKRVQPDTIVLSAEKLGIPTGAGVDGAPSRQKLSRSNTVTSNATARTTTTVGTTATATKKKKKKRPVNGTINEADGALLPPPPTAADLASSLPSAMLRFDPNSVTLPLPSDLPDHEMHTAGLSTTAQTKAHATDSTPTQPESGHVTTTTSGTGAAGKVPKSLAETQKRAKRDSALLGTNDWVTHPAAVVKHQKHASTTAALKKSDVVEGQDSLMTLVDRAEGGEDRIPSRKYGPNGGNQVASEASAAAGVVTPRSVSTGSGLDGLGKRKSVRLAADPVDTEDAAGSGGATDSALLAPPRSMSPALSAKSEARSVTPSKGILVNARPASPAQALVNSSPSKGGWDTRLGQRNGTSGGVGGTVGDDTSEDSDDGEYKKMRKKFAKHSKGMEDVMSGTFTAEQKGKSKAA